MHVLGSIQHFCVDCKPRPLDAKGAANRQMKRALVERAVADAITEQRVENQALDDYEMQMTLLGQKRNKERLQQYKKELLEKIKGLEKLKEGLNSDTYLNGRPPTRSGESGESGESGDLISGSTLADKQPVGPSINTQ